MRILVLAIIVFCSCTSGKDQSSLVTNDLAFFERYAPECESFLEGQNKCKASDCFNAAAIEIVGVDTSITDTHRVFAWCWVQQFRMIDTLPAGNKGIFTPACIKVQSSGRSISVLEIFLPDPEKPLKEQLETNGFPDMLIKSYFTNQRNEVEMERLRVLAEKAKEKYRMFLEKAYVPEVAH